MNAHIDPVKKVGGALSNAADQSVWPASLHLRLERRAKGTRLVRCRHSGPLYVQKAFYPEGPDCAHIYLLHPPGGIVSGDTLNISIEAAADTKVLVTTPGAARIYRAREQHPEQHQCVQLLVEEGASLEWFPLETIVFDGAQVELETTVSLAADSSFVGWEINCLGLPASERPFRQGRFEQRYKIVRDGLPLFVERFVLDENTRQQMAGKAALQGRTVSGFFILGPVIDDNFESNIMQSLREKAAELDMQSLAAISKVGEFFIGRYLGDSAEQGRQIFTAWWQLLRPGLLQRPASPPRIWMT